MARPNIHILQDVRIGVAAAASDGKIIWIADSDSNEEWQVGVDQKVAENLAAALRTGNDALSKDGN